jgi:electron transfer flavoprotein alpha subunit
MSTISVVVTRGGLLPLGADEAVAEAGGQVLLIGSGTRDAAGQLTAATNVYCCEAGDYAPARWSASLIGPLGHWHAVALPASADGRDCAPRLAAALGRPLLAGASAVTDSGARLLRWGGRVEHEVRTEEPFVATLQPGVRGVAPAEGAEPVVEDVILPDADVGQAPDASVLELADPDPETADLAEAPRILSAGAGLGTGERSGPEALDLLGKVAAALGASLGATRVVTDAGWASYQRQIGTTGVLASPDLYVAFGVSGAAQHLGGLGEPEHVVSVNTDSSCPMSQVADLALVADAPAVLDKLAEKLLGGTP